MSSNGNHLEASNSDSFQRDDELIHLAYVSTQSRSMTAADLIGLLQQARKKTKNAISQGCYCTRTNPFSRSSRATAAMSTIPSQISHGT